MATNSVHGYKMYDDTIAYISVGKIKTGHVQRVEWKPGTNRWEALFFMKDGTVIAKKVVARVGGKNV